MDIKKSNISSSALAKRQPQGNRDYSGYTREQLIKELQLLNKQKKYGIVWEEKTEEVVERCKKEVPILKSVHSRRVKDKKDNFPPKNVLIEGDNYHSLQVLNYTHKGKIDVIYIDPPYNTGAKNWKYNNDYVDKEDTFRHSKWLSFMHKRLRLSKNLLKKTGLIVVTIDNYEIGPLRLLMDEVFGEESRLGLITIMHNPGGRSDDLYFANCHEYALVYGNGAGQAVTYKIHLTEEQKEKFSLEDEISRYRLVPFKRTGSNSTPNERPNLFYPIYYNVKTGEITLEKKANLVEIIPLDNEGKNRVWRWGKETLGERKSTEIVVKKSSGGYSVYTKDRIQEGRRPKTVWIDPKYASSSHGTLLLQQILGDRNSFDYPKSLYAVKDILEVGVREKRDAIVLDFFAGSGTTGHAVLELNKDDDGNRQFILCTNNENNNGNGHGGIAESVCYPRIKRVIEGYRKNRNGEKVEGLRGGAVWNI